jgi:hypothetical protein
VTHGDVHHFGAGGVVGAHVDTPAPMIVNPAVA